jgi:hypothetical protein
MPTWEAMKSNPKNTKKIKFVSVSDVELNKMSGDNKPVVTGYPTIKINIKGNEYDYPGKREESDIFQFIISKIKGGNTTSTTDAHTITPMSEDLQGGMNEFYTEAMENMIRNSTNKITSVSTEMDGGMNEFYTEAMENMMRNSTNKITSVSTEMDGGMNEFYTEAMENMLRNSTNKTPHNIFTPLSSHNHTDTNTFSASSTVNTVNTKGVRYAPRINLKF